jgi:hypothetical protein
MRTDKIRWVLFIVFVSAFVATIAMTLWSYGLHAGLFGAQPQMEDKYLGWMLGAIILELVAAVIMLWKDVFGLSSRAQSAEINKIHSRLDDIDEAILSLKRVRTPRNETIQCSVCGRTIAEIDVSKPGSREIACSICGGGTRVKIDENGSITTSRF